MALLVSMDNGATWTTVVSDPHPANPSDSEAAPYLFSSAGTALVRATAVASNGRSASQSATLTVGKASQAAPAISPPTAAISAGQSVVFSASGGATGNYSWGGSGSGSAVTDSVSFPIPGTYTVTLVDTGNANYKPSAPASASVSVGPALFTLSLSATAGGSVTGGGSYPPGSQATAAAVASPGNAFTGWTGTWSPRPRPCRS